LFEAIALSTGILGKRLFGILLLLWIIPKPPGPQGQGAHPFLRYISTWFNLTHLWVQYWNPPIDISTSPVLHCAFTKEIENIIMMMKADRFFDLFSHFVLFKF